MCYACECHILLSIFTLGPVTCTILLRVTPTCRSNFVDYIRGGCQISLMVAVDFTVSVCGIYTEVYGGVYIEVYMYVHALKYTCIHVHCRHPMATPLIQTVFTTSILPR